MQGVGMTGFKGRKEQLHAPLLLTLMSKLSLDERYTSLCGGGKLQSPASVQDYIKVALAMAPRTSRTVEV